MDCRPASSLLVPRFVHRILGKVEYVGPSSAAKASVHQGTESGGQVQGQLHGLDDGK